MSHRDINVRLYFLGVNLFRFIELDDSLVKVVSPVCELNSLGKQFVVKGRFIHFLFGQLQVILDGLRILSNLKISISQIFVDKRLYFEFLTFFMTADRQEYVNGFLRLLLHHSHHSLNKQRVKLYLFCLLQLEEFNPVHRVMRLVKITKLYLNFYSLKQRFIDAHSVIVEF